MGGKAIDVHGTRKFGSVVDLAKLYPIVIGAILLGVLMIALANIGSENRQTEGLILGLLLIVGALIFLAHAYRRSREPSRTLLELSPAGVHYHLGEDKTFRIPWNQIHGLTTIDIRSGKITFRDVTALVVSDDFFEANLPLKSWWERAGWGSHFIPKDGMMQVALFHEGLSASADELWDEVETRWRVLSGHPDAPVLSSPRIVKKRGWIGTWSPSPPMKRAGAAVIITLVLPAIYFWQWTLAWMTFPDISDDSAAYYLGETLKRGGAHARVSGAGMVKVHRSEVTEIRRARCSTEIAHDPERSGLTPGFAAAAYCTADLDLTSGASAKAIFKLTGQTFASEDWEGKPTEYKAIWPAELAVEEADARLCQLGSCTEG